MDADDVTLLPVAVDDEIAVLQLAIDSLAVDRNLVGAEDVVTIGIKVTRHHPALYPTRDTDHHVESLCLVLHNLDGDVAVPGIVGALFQYDILTAYGDGGGVGGEEVHVEVIVADTIDIARHGGDEATEVRGTAGTTEPWLARHGAIGIETVLSVARQRVRIEELTAIDAHAADDTII